ncbi:MULTISPECIES: DMT family transporter [unclassified Pseudoalteromonas]|uniref:DMT family transporter n=1 Tax=unclassified Pseudoalteromonas TaxID=194690 RepID=UPI002096F4D7|nr:DMT family transporter [Pseudoalteromonas sp. XMcav2-N]MCO7188411.1 DMT family transporter [Pseudoalteromonas sp. XMcav2-N]
MSTSTSPPVSETQDKTALFAFLALLVTMLMFGSAFASSKFVVNTLPFEVAAALRFCGGSVFLIILSIFLRNKQETVSIAVSTKFALAGLLGVFAYNVMFFLGLSLAPSMDGSIIVPVLSPIITLAILLFMKKETASYARIFGMALGLIGASMFLFEAIDTESSSSRAIGDLYFVLGAACWGAYSIVSKGLFSKHKLSPLLATTYSTLGGTLLLVIFSLPKLTEVDWASVPMFVWANIIYLSIGPTAVAYLFYFYALRTVSASTATIMMFTVPVFGVAFSSVFLNESILPSQIAGAFLMLAGSLIATGILTTLKNNKKEKQ